MDAPDPVGASRRDVHRPDHVGEPDVADRTSRRRAQTSSVIPGLGDVEHATREFHRQAIRGDHLDGRESPFGLVVPFNNSAAFRWIASSASSSRIRRRAAANSARSPEARPGSIPWSTRS